MCWKSLSARHGAVVCLLATTLMVATYWSTSNFGQDVLELSADSDCRCSLRASISAGESQALLHREPMHTSSSSCSSHSGSSSTQIRMRTLTFVCRDNLTCLLVMCFVGACGSPLAAISICRPSRTTEAIRWLAGSRGSSSKQL